MKTTKAIVFIEEIPTDGHSPMKFLCDDGQIYFCKYMLSAKKEELDCLIYEVVCHFLLKSLLLPTPNIAFIELIEGVFYEKDIPRNRKYAKPSVICFGSQEVKNANLVSGLELVTDAHSLQTLYNPYDLIRIAIFDLWVDNTDRGKNSNYNLLVSPHENKLKIWAFDHAFTFDGLESLRIFNPKFQPSLYNKLFTTSYFLSIVSHLDPELCHEVALKFIENLEKSVGIIDSIFEQIPQKWQVYPSLKLKIHNFLLDSQRLAIIKELTLKQLSKK
ncbi:HipA family kinase [Runella limosa]|uniref:HipA family kinase n=1 Tax=Runella limosa TaxID=370978 RepID=UPI0004010F31|nr:HipA family kinase [Runella limosa]